VPIKLSRNRGIEYSDSEIYQHIEALEAGNRHIPSATFAPPSMAPLTADVGPSAVLLQDRHDAAPGISRSPAFPESSIPGSVKKSWYIHELLHVVNPRQRENGWYHEVIVMKKNILKTWIPAMLVSLLLLVIVPGLSLAGDEDSYFQEGTRLLKQGALDQAAAVLTEAIDVTPDHVEAYNNRGLAYFEQKKYTEAQQDFLTAIHLSPFDKQANNNLGILFCGRGDYDRALLYFQRAVQKGDTPTPYDMVVYRNLAFVYMKKGMTKEAAEAYEKARCIQDKISEDLDLRPYGEAPRDYTLTLEFSTTRVQEKRRLKRSRQQSRGDGKPVNFFYDR